MHFDTLLIATIFLLLLTVATTILYYRRIKKAREEYEEAKGIVSDIIISFNKQVQRQENQLSGVSQKLEALFARSEKVARGLEEQETRIADLTSKVAGVSVIEQKMYSEIEEMKKKVNGVIKTQGEIMSRIAEVPEAKIEAAIPIRKDRALAPLTETELRVLEIIAEEGAKTAPEVKGKIKLTREHTARLMKKLYEEGYLERDSAKTPYAYRVKEEMLKILKKAETKA